MSDLGSGAQKCHACTAIKPSFRLVVEVDTRVLAGEISTLAHDIFGVWQCIVMRSICSLFRSEFETDTRLDSRAGCVETQLERCPSPVDINFRRFAVDSLLPDFFDCTGEKSSKFEWDLVNMETHMFSPFHFLHQQLDRPTDVRVSDNAKVCAVRYVALFL